MKEYLRELVDRSRTSAEAGLMVREYLQARVLEALQLAGARRLRVKCTRSIFAPARRPLYSPRSWDFREAACVDTTTGRQILERTADIELLTRDNVLELLKG